MLEKVRQSAKVAERTRYAHATLDEEAPLPELRWLYYPHLAPTNLGSRHLSDLAGTAGVGDASQPPREGAWDIAPAPLGRRTGNPGRGPGEQAPPLNKLVEGPGLWQAGTAEGVHGVSDLTYLVRLYPWAAG